MPRLLIISRSHNPLGGADRIISDLCRHLPALGWETILGLTRGASFDDPAKYLAVHAGLEAVDIDGTLGTRPQRVRSLSRTICSLKPDIVLGMRVFDLVEAVHHVKKKFGSQAPRLVWGVRAFEPPFIHDAHQFKANIDYFVTSGRLIADVLHRFAGVPCERIASIAGGVTPPIIEPVPCSRQSKPVRLLYAGRLEQAQKRVRDLIPLVQHLRHHDISFHLDICGAGPEEDFLRQSLEVEVMRGAVEFHGWVSRDELYRKFYPGADIFLHLAGWEGVTISPREAMAHGVVPVISEFLGIYSERHFLHGINSLIFPVGDIEAAAAHIATLVSRPDLIARLSSNAITSQADRYSFDGALVAWRDVFDACLSLPVKMGLPRFPQERMDGRLSRWGLPTSWQSNLRTWLRVPVRHCDPGSEWPTHSATISMETQKAIMRFASLLEAESLRAAVRCQ